MAQPTKYVRQYNFNDYSTTSPSTPHLGSKVDLELDTLKITTDAVCVNLGLIQRDDGELANLSVHTEALSNAVLALIKATDLGYGVKGTWVTGEAYAVGDLVDHTQATWLCFEAHTSGSTWLEYESKFILFANAAIQTTASAVDTFSGDNTTQIFTLSENAPSGVTDVLVFVNGVLRTPTTDYTVTETTVTFAVAPSTGTSNVIVWGTSTVVEAAKAAAIAARDAAEAHRDDASQHKQTAERWANLEDATVVDVDTSVDSLEYSAKEYAIGDTLPTGSSKEWATNAGSAEVATGAGYSSKAYAQNTGDDIGSAKDWAVLGTQVSSTDYSSKQYAVGTPPDGSAKEWATETGVVTGSLKGAKGYADDMATQVAAATASQEAAANSAAAVSASFDAFDDRYLGVMLDTGASATVSTTGTWDAASSSITVASDAATLGIIIGQKLTTVASGYPTSANVISVTGSVVVISEPFTVAGAATAVQFIGYGVYGDFSGVTDGPDKDNDGVTLGALHKGLMYFNSSDREMRVFDGSVWLAASSAGSSSMVLHKYISDATSPTSVLSASFSPVLSYSSTNVIVFLNGVSLIDTTDYVATNGSDITGLSALATSDELVVVAFKSFEVTNVEGTSIKSTGEADETKFLRVTGAGASWVAIDTSAASQSASTNLTGAIADQYFLSLAYVLTGDVTIAGDNVFGKIVNGTTDISLTNDSSDRIISGPETAGVDATITFNGVMFN